ncbi:MAG: glycosyltransferase family 4 protein [Cyanosarcina radialis HA8281-LM2]|jgi:glycosyltransferase involved in cell wall biosynthesis|nr:glycosyltransferase family 4 protein [Cyanosarcina radialis HA8281-LM2]
MSKRLKILYAAGPGNIIGTYNYWIKNEDDPSQVAITYSGQFYEVCRELEARAYAISSDKEKKVVDDERFRIEHRPFPSLKNSPIFYHLGLLWYGLRLMVSAVRFQVDVVVVADGTTHWFILPLLSWFGIQIIPSLHCVPWSKYVPTKKTQRLFLRLSRHLFVSSPAILVVSDEIADRVSQITNNRHRLILKTVPVYRRSQFVGIEAPDLSSYPFRVLFVGRIEADKGVFDLLEIAKRFASEGRKDFRFDLCGDGSALESLRLAAKAAEVEHFFVCHGHCERPEMRQMYGQSHLVVVPTKTSFVEGFNKVVVEGILAGRPVVTSAVCPALSEVRPAVLEVPPDDIAAYGDALTKLREDREFYREKQQNCLALQEKFYDFSQSWGTQLKSVLLSIQEGN